MYNIFLWFRPTDTNIRGKVVLISGASSGIREFLAYEYAKREAFLVIVARREERLEKSCRKTRGIGSPDVLIICGDVSDFNDCRRFIDEAINHFGLLDHLVNNAGIGNIFMVNEGIEINKFAPVMDINFWGSIYPTHFAIPHLKKTEGTMIVNASNAGCFNMPRSGFYNLRIIYVYMYISCLNLKASKSAVTSFYESLRAELGPEINITIVTLGYVESEMTLGKQMSKECEMKHNQEIKDVSIKSTIQL
ncbi:11-beta-hydroxysteroid dehydrogenase-like [Primulina eburnea]|uniref:11-beta-hydroxysteroid dehydrogenase-like n=1 Tax=Primulina eburnea TaxID=1245227 RepID=UPI003C6C17CF